MRLMLMYNKLFSQMEKLPSDSGKFLDHDVNVKLLWKPASQRLAVKFFNMNEYDLESRRCLFPYYLVGGLETAVSDLRHAELLMIGLLRRDDRRVGDQRKMNPGIRDQIRLELRQIHIEGAVKPQRGRYGGHNLPDQAVEIGVGGPIDVQITATDVVDGLVVDHEGAVWVFEGGVGCEDGVVGLHHSGGHLWVESGHETTSLQFSHFLQCRPFLKDVCIRYKELTLAYTRAYTLTWNIEPILTKIMF